MVSGGGAVHVKCKVGRAKKRHKMRRMNEWIMLHAENWRYHIQTYPCFTLSKCEKWRKERCGVAAMARWRMTGARCSRLTCRYLKFSERWGHPQNVQKSKFWRKNIENTSLMPFSRNIFKMFTWKKRKTTSKLICTCVVLSLAGSKKL